MTAALTLPPFTRVRTSGLVLAVASALAFASSGPTVKPLLEAGWSIGAVLLLRMAGGALLLSPWLIAAMVRERGFLRRHGLLIVGFGLTAVAGCQLLYYSAMQRMPVAVALLVQYLAPVILVGWGWARTRRRPARVVLVGTAVAMVGLVLVIDVTGARFDPLGVALALGAAVCTAMYFVISDRTGDRVPPLALAAGGLLTGTIVIGVLCAVGVFSFVAPPVAAAYAGFAVPWFVSIVWVVIVATALGYGLGVAAVPQIGARLASFLGLTEVLFAVGFAWLLLGETISLVQMVGGALVLAGVVLVRADARSPGEPRGEAASVPVVPAP
jgi:drug/metabolite transporter (DMT)-like permease